MRSELLEGLQNLQVRESATNFLKQMKGVFQITDSEINEIFSEIYDDIPFHKIEVEHYLDDAISGKSVVDGGDASKYRFLLKVATPLKRQPFISKRNKYGKRNPIEKPILIFKKVKKEKK